ncbi:MAG: tetratricopeptide repeat protein [Phycisphaerae bacterium]|nr:tetratricopeptide repeat protein [Phycisphaerae bacterium]
MRPTPFLLFVALVLFQSNLAQADEAGQLTPPQIKAADPETPIETDPQAGAWLVELARHQGHLIGRTDPRSASLQVLALLKAAAQVAPECADAQYWLFDVESRLGRVDNARRALKEYVRLSPQDDAARIRLFQIELAERQTAEARVAFVESELTQPVLSRAYESELHRWLARYYFERRENGSAARQIEQALRLNPTNINARQIAFEMFAETEPSLQRVEMALQLISANPSQTNLIWDLGESLDRLGMHDRAQEWYNRAIQLHRQSNAGPVPADYWHKLAVSYLNGGDAQRCLNAADAALKVDPNLHIARLLRSTAKSRLGDEAGAAADVEFVTRAYEARMQTVLEQKDYAAAAEIAWFFAFHKPDAARALKFAEFAMKEPEPSSLARLSYGYALKMSGRKDEAMAALKALVSIDQLAALEIARIQFEQDKKGAAITTLHKAATLQYDGIAFDMIADLLRKHGETPPIPPKYQRIADALDRFNRDVFDYLRRPQDFIDASMTFADDPLPAVGPIRVTFRIENVGPFPITFGEGYMARPLIALTAKINGQGRPSFENYLQVMLNSRPTLLPGDAIEKTIAINVGPLQQALLQYSGSPAQLRLLAVFDPIILDGRLSAGPGSLELAEINATRPAIDASAEGISTLTTMAASAQIEDRIKAADRIGALLSAIEASEGSGPLAKVPVNTLRSELAKLLNDEAWQVRAHALVAAGWSTLEQRIIAVAASLRLRNEMPIVRMLAVKLFAEQHGEKFRAVLDQLAENDPSELVRMVAASYLRPGE